MDRLSPLAVSGSRTGDPKCVGSCQAYQGGRHLSLGIYQTPPGTFTKAVMRVDAVSSGHLTCTLLQRESDSVYLLPPTASPAVVTAILTPDSAIVMGKVQNIVPGAIVQLAGVLDQTHTLCASQVVVLTGYVHLTESQDGSR
jgi:hypothetical protein